MGRRKEQADEVSFEGEERTGRWLGETMEKKKIGVWRTRGGGGRKE